MPDYIVMSECPMCGGDHKPSEAHNGPDAEKANIARQFICKECERVAAAGFGPRHNASPRCESGGRDHCACDTCF